ncbi:hypothetical protein AgCh_030069 [Apium graveolens]
MGPVFDCLRSWAIDPWVKFVDGSEARRKFMKRGRKAITTCRDIWIKQLWNQALGIGGQLNEALWDKEGKPVELVVVRESADRPLSLVVEAVKTNPNTYRWPVPEPKWCTKL